MKISRKEFGILCSGKKVQLYTLKAGDVSLSITTLGATFTSLCLPSRKGPKTDVLLGYSTLAGYACNQPYFGATIGRVGNRIRGGKFVLDGKTYALCKNDGEHTLHGGRLGFDKLVWKAEAYTEQDGVFVRFELVSPDGDEGFPGNCKAAVCYGLTKSQELIADYQAVSDAPTPINLTNHAYFNLAGEGNGDILPHELLLHASSYVKVDQSLVPTGELVPVRDSPFDFTARKPIGRDIRETGIGYDHCFVVDGEMGTLRPCAEVFESGSGRAMRVFTTQPGVQLYTGNFLKEVTGKSGFVYNKFSGFCLETQHFPDSPNQEAFPSCIFGPGRKYHEKTLFSFEVR